MRPTVALVFGQGLDRGTGQLAVPPDRMDVLENVVVFPGRVEPRRGMETRSTVALSTYIAGIHAERTTFQGVVVYGFGTPGEVDHNLQIYRTRGDGTTPTLVGEWADPCLSTSRARAILAPSGSRVFIAHDERVLSRRAGTKIFNGADNTLSDLTAEFARGSEPGNSNIIRFRWVASHLEYIVGGGFLTNETDGPEVVRVSDPSQPTVFQETSYVVPGQPGDPVLIGMPLFAGQVGILLLMKASETHYLAGSSASDFGIFELDKRYGVAAPRLAASDGRAVYFWSLEGPRRFVGLNVSEDISWPLGLDWPTTDDIAAQDLLEDGFAEYLPVKRQIQFVFGTYVYSFDLRTEQWQHEEKGVEVFAGGILYARTGYTGPSRGYPDFGAVSVIDGDSRRIGYSNVNAEGDEIIEVWTRIAAGSWGVSPALTRTVGEPTVFDLDDLLPNTTYEVALRYVRDGQYTTGYTGDPDTWPAVSLGSFEVGAISVPAISSLTWSRTSDSAEQIAVVYAGDMRVEILRGTTTVFADAVAVFLSTDNSGTYNDPISVGEVRYYYWVRSVAPDDERGAESSVSSCWAGPDMPFNLDLDPQTSVFYSYNVDVRDTSYYTELWDDNGAGGALALRTTMSPGISGGVRGVSAMNAGNLVEVEVRHRVTTFGVNDYSAFLAGEVQLLAP